ncbi:MAG: YdcF family protein [Pseudomonadota bacterium]
MSTISSSTMGVGEVLFAVVQPSNAMALFALVGAALRLMGLRLGNWCLAAAGIALLLFGLLPTGQLVLEALERRVPSELPLAEVDVIIVLGGYHPATNLLGRGIDPARIPLNQHGDRLTAGAALAARFPDAKLLLTDGGEPAGADLSAALVQALGIAPDRIIVERHATSTFENALLSLELLAPLGESRVVIVSSAWHLPRALATFRSAGFQNVVPWPVDFVSDGVPPWQNWPGSVAAKLSHADLAAREIAALVYYRLTGRIHALFPTAIGGGD